MERVKATLGLRAPLELAVDVACGAGQLTIPAARAGVRATGVDIATNSLGQARARAAAEGLEVRFDEGDAEALPYPDASFDTVTSLVGAMFAPRPERVAAELVRVCRPGGRILGVAGMGLLAGVVGGAVLGLVRVPPRPEPRAGEGA